MACTGLLVALAACTPAAGANLLVDPGYREQPALRHPAQWRCSSAGWWGITILQLLHFHFRRVLAMRSFFRVCVLLATVAILAPAKPAFAFNYYYNAGTFDITIYGLDIGEVQTGPINSTWLDDQAALTMDPGTSIISNGAGGDINVGTNNRTGKLDMYSASITNPTDFYVGGLSGAHGTVNMDGSIIGNSLRLYVGEDATGTVNMANSSTFNNGFVAIVGGSGGTGVVNVQDSAFTAAEMIVGNAGDGTVNVGGASIVGLNATSGVLEGTLDIGRWGGNGTVMFGGSSTLDVSGRTNIGNNNNLSGGPLSSGILTLSGFATMNTHPGPARNWGAIWGDTGDVYVGCNEWENGAVPFPGTHTGLGGVGSLIVKDAAQLTVGGDVGGSASVQVGINGGTGTMLVSNTAMVYVAADINVGYLSGFGTVTMTDASTILKSALFNSYVTIGCNGAGVWDHKGGFADLRTSVYVGQSGGTGTLNLDGGNFATGFIQVGDSTGHGTITFNGGTLTVNTASPQAPFGAPFITSTVIPNPNARLVVKAGGANIDTSGRNCSITLPLLHDGLLGNTHDGGLTKFGAGTLTLNGDNNYFGWTDVENGGIDLANSASLWIDINEPGAGNYWTQIVGTGGAEFFGKLNIDVNGVSPNTQSGSWLVVHVLDLTEYFDPNLVLDLNGSSQPFVQFPSGVYTYHQGPRTWQFTESDGYLRLTTVPEPGTLALLAAGLIGLLTYAWRKRK
jgi:autotransporter-associated beta strand protein